MVVVQDNVRNAREWRSPTSHNNKRAAEFIAIISPVPCSSYKHGDFHSVFLWYPDAPQNPDKGNQERWITPGGCSSSLACKHSIAPIPKDRVANGPLGPYETPCQGIGVTFSIK